MRRSFSVLLWILLGALASGASIGFFLHQSNQDRLALVRQLDDTQRKLDMAERLNEQMHAEAAQKIADARLEASTMQQQIKQLDTAHSLSLKAQPLPKVTSPQVKQWAEQVSIPLGLSFLTPPRSQSWVTDQMMGVGSGNPRSTQGLDQWLSVSSYDQKREETIRLQLEQPQDVVFQVGDRLLVGTRGLLKDTDWVTYVLQSQTDGQPTHFLWARTNKDVTETQLLQTLGTFQFGPGKTAAAQSAPSL